MIEVVRRIWKDPVVSNILGAAGYSALSAVGIAIVWPVLNQNWVACSAVGVLIPIETLLVWTIFRRPSAIVTNDAGARYFSRRTRLLAQILAITVPILLPALGWAVALHLCRSDSRTFVFVANFEPSVQAAHYRVTRVIFEHLREALAVFPDTVPQLIGKTVSWDKDDPVSALTWCQRQQKAILIWGDFDTTRDTVVVTAHFKLLKRSGNPLQGSKETRSPLGELENFSIQDNLAHRFAYGALLVQGITRFEKSDFDSAVRMLTAAIAEAPGQNVDPALFYRAWSFFEKGRYEDAIADYSTIIDHAPDYLYALNNRGACYVAIGQFQAGYSDLSRAIATQPADSLAYVNRGGALYKLRRLSEALDDYNRAIKFAPRDPRAYTGRGNVYDKMDEIDKALADYDKAAALDKYDPGIYFNRAITLHGHGRDDAAIDSMGTVLLLEKTVQAYEYRGYLFLLTGRRSQGISDYRSALQLASSTSEREEIRERLRDLGEHL